MNNLIFLFRAEKDRQAMKAESDDMKSSLDNALRDKVN